MQTRSVSDPRDNFPEIEKNQPKEDESVYFTKNGYGATVDMNLEKYAEFTDEAEIKLDEADIAVQEDKNRYTHEEVFEKIKKMIKDETD